MKSFLSFSLAMAGLIAPASAAGLLVGNTVEYNFSSSAGYSGNAGDGTYSNTVKLTKNGGQTDDEPNPFVYLTGTTAYDNFGNLTDVTVIASAWRNGGGAELFVDPPGGSEPGFLGSKNGAVITLTFSGLDTNTVYDLSLALGGVYSSGHNLGFDILTGWTSTSSTSTTASTGVNTADGTYTGVGTADITNHETFAWRDLRADEYGNIVLQYTANGPRSGISNLSLTATGTVQPIPEPGSTILAFAGLALAAIRRRR